MTRLRVRWAAGLGDEPAAGEAVVRMSRVSGSRETYPGAGLLAPRLLVDAQTGEIAAAASDGPSDLVLHRSRITLTVTSADGRQLVARFDPAADAPLIPEDAPEDLRDALRRAWRQRPPKGRPSDRVARIEAIVAAAADLPAGGDHRDRVAAALGRVRHEDGDLTDEPSSAFKDDVKRAGGWEAIQRRAEELRATR